MAAGSLSPNAMTKAQIIAPLDATAGGGNASPVKTSNPTSSANDTAVVASFNPIAGETTSAGSEYREPESKH